MLSVIIPSRNEQLYLEKTIRNVLDNAEGEIEILVILDGWLPNPRIDMHDNRVLFIHNKEAIGQRQGINQAAKMAKGKYIMKLDAHCAVDKGFDLILARDCEYNMTMIPRMYNLDVVTWEPKKHKKTDYMYIGKVDGNLRAQYYRSKELPVSDKQIDDTMCCMGPCFFMHKDRFWELEGCDEGHGSWGQQGVEVACKAWLSGGRLVVNKNTWFAHFFRGGGVPDGHKSGFPYSIKQQHINKARHYSNNLWMNNKWHLQKRSFEWLIKKFNPPTWEVIPDPIDNSKLNLFDRFYKKIRRQHKMDCKWRGQVIQKFPMDLMLLQEVIYENRPDIIVEIGTKYGASALFLQDILDLNGGGKVVTIDIKDQVKNKDPRVTYLIGKSRDEKIIDKVKSMISEGDKVMVIIDGDHSRIAVKWDLKNYHSLVTSGQYLVVEDCYLFNKLYGPGEARDWFLEWNNNFIQTNLCDKYLVGLTMGGWLKKK